MKLRDYQEQTSTHAAETIIENGLAYLAWECRTGKSITGLVTAKKYGAKSVLVITKKKAITSFQNDYETLRNLTLPNGDLFEVEILNYESVHKVKITPDFVIIDEAHNLGQFPKPSQRTRQLKEICKGLPILFMSGTPTPESYSQLYHQLWVSDYTPFKEYKTFYKWSKEYVKIHEIRVNGFRINDYSDANKEKIDKAVDHLFFRYTQNEAGFSCEINEEDLCCPISDDLRRWIYQLKKDLVLHLPNGEVVCAGNAATLLTKLHQLSGGTVITDSGQHLILDKTKALFIRDFFKEQKIAIFYYFQSEFELLKSVFPNYTESPEEFQSSTDKTFISQVKKAREGVRLDKADGIVFYNMEFSFLSYEQGKNRIVSKERNHPANVYFATSVGGIEEDILAAVRQKKDFTLSWYMKRNPK